jgi:hypothetical protein
MGQRVLVAVDNTQSIGRQLRIIPPPQDRSTIHSMPSQTSIELPFPKAMSPKASDG